MFFKHRQLPENKTKRFNHCYTQQYLDLAVFLLDHKAFLSAQIYITMIRLSQGLQQVL